MKILVTGAGGFLGFHLAKALKEEGHEVIGLARRHYPKLATLGIPQVQGDIRNRADLEQALEGVESVFHTAGKVGIWGRPSDFASINIDGTRLLVEVMKERRIKYLVFTSSPSVVFGTEDLAGVDESVPYPESYLADYPKSKALAEKFVLSATNEDFQALALRPHLIYGREDLNLLPRVLARARERKLKIIGNGKNKVDIIHIDNAVHAHLCAWRALLAGRPVSGKAYFVANERPVLLWGFINEVLRLNKIPEVHAKVPLWFLMIVATFFEKIYTLLGKYDSEPPLTRFSAQQLAKSHYFSHAAAQRDLDYYPIRSYEDSLLELTQ